MQTDEQIRRRATNKIIIAVVWAFACMHFVSRVSAQTFYRVDTYTQPYQTDSGYYPGSIQIAYTGTIQFQCGYTSPPIPVFECWNAYPSGSNLTLTVSTRPGYDTDRFHSTGCDSVQSYCKWKFDQWSGDCSGTSATCVLTINGPKKVFAEFKILPVDPGPPTAVALTALNAGTSISFQPARLGTGTFIKYFAVCDGPDGKTVAMGMGDKSPIVINGLLNGVRYSCGVATNTSVGESDVMKSVFTVVPSSTSPNPPVPVTEFYNSSSDTYFMTAGTTEAVSVFRGSAGSEWRLTGATFNVGGNATTPVCRFYGSVSPGPNSHFYTADAGECAYLKQLQTMIPATEPRWNFEGLDFYTTVPTNGSCPGSMIPIYRAYNRGDVRGLPSNHRFGTSAAALEVIARGWRDEGIVMCAPTGN